MSKRFDILHTLPSGAKASASYITESLEEALEKFRKVYPTFQIRCIHEYDKNSNYLYSHRYNIDDEAFRNEVKKRENKYEKAKHNKSSKQKKSDIDPVSSFIGLAIIVGIIIVGFAFRDSDPVQKQNSKEEITYTPTIGFKGEDYEQLYEQLEEGMKLEEVKNLFEGEPDTVGDVYWEDGKKYQTFGWIGDDGSGIGCDFVDDICNYKNGWTSDGEWERE